MYTKTLLLALSLLLAAVVGVGAYPGHQGQGHYQDFMADLTPEQQDKVTKSTDAHHEKLFALNKELEAKEAAVDALFAVVPPDKAAIEAGMAEINALQAQKAKLNADYRLELMEITGKPMPAQSGKGCGAKTSCTGAGCGQKACTTKAQCGESQCGQTSRCGAAAPGCGPRCGSPSAS